MKLSIRVRAILPPAAGVLLALLSACGGGSGTPTPVAATRAAGGSPAAPAPESASAAGGASAASAPETTDATDAIPWVDVPSTPRSLAGSASAERPCAAADLDVVAGRFGAFQGQATQELILRDHAAVACYLAGVPQAVVPNMGARSRVSPGPFAGRRLDLAPGQSATVLLGTPAVCAAAGQPVLASTVQLTLPNGDEVAVSGVRIDTECGAPSVVTFEAVPPPAAAPDPLSALVVSVAAPATVARGAVLSYRVTVANRSAQAVALSPCPSYTQVLGTGGASVQQTLLLNCQAAASIPANGALTFAIQLTVPATTPAGTTKVSWQLEVPDGPVAGAAVSVR